MKQLILALIFGFFSFQSPAQLFQEVGVGAELIYNAPIGEPGIGIRAHLHSTDYIFFSPQLFYYPGIRNIHELYLGLSGNVKLFPDWNWTPYLAGGGVYNYWINFAASPIANPSAHNFAGEGGIGLTKNFGCYRPFLSYRVNSKWWESNYRIGVVVYFGDCKGNKRRGNSSDCPAFTLR